MPALPISAAEAVLGAATRAKLDDALKSGTSGGVTIAGPIALTALPAVVLDLYEIAFLAGLQASQASPTQLPSHVKSALPSPAAAGQMIYVTDDVGGAVPAFSDGANWRRVTDRAIVS